MPSGAVARRMVTVPAVVACAAALTASMPLWLPLLALIDAVRGRFRLPLVRLVAFGVCWAWLEVTGVVAASLLWLLGRRSDTASHYALQRWWAARIVGSLQRTCGLRFVVRGIDTIGTGPILLLARHVSLADSAISAVVVAVQAGLRPRFVLKRELLADPCLDIVGNRVPNHFVDRGATDTVPELHALRALTSGLGRGDAAVIFPEGTRANPHKLSAALARIGQRDAKRAARLSALRHLLPPRPSGAMSMAAGAPDADVVLGWHVGLEGMDTFTGVLRALSHGPIEIDYHLRRIPRADVGEDVGRWLDEQWLAMDAEIDAALVARRSRI